MQRDPRSSVSPELKQVRLDNEALSNFQKGIIGFDVFLSSVRPSIKVKTQKVYREFQDILPAYVVDEVAQEMELVLWNKAKDIRAGVWFSKFVGECAKRLLLDMASRERSLLRGAQPHEVPRDAEGEPYMEPDPPDIDRQRALDNLKKLLKSTEPPEGDSKAAVQERRDTNIMQTVTTSKPYLSFVDQAPEVRDHRSLRLFVLEVSEEALAAQKFSRVKRLREDHPGATPEHKELIRIYKESGLTLKQFAQELKVERETLCSYLYINTKSVPEKVMARARTFAGGDIVIYQRYRTKSMSEIFEGWATQLGLDPQASPTLYVIGLILGGVSQLTLRRWRNNETRPGDEALNRYDIVIRLMEGTLKQDGYRGMNLEIEKLLARYGVKDDSEDGNDNQDAEPKKEFQGIRIVRRLMKKKMEAEERAAKQTA